MQAARETPAQPTPGERTRLVRPLVDAGSPEAAALKPEVELLAQLQARNVVQVLGTVTQDGKFCCVLERVEAEDLETQLKNGHRFTTEEILHIADEIARGLAAIAQRGFLHRDLRPANVLMLEEGRVKLANVGPLAPLQKLEGGTAPQPSAVAYLSPEQGMGQAIDIRSNIYSLGAILYELATQRPPFEGYDSSTSLLYQLLHVDPVSPRQLGASIPKELERTILRCLAKMPADRYAHPSELLDAIQHSRDSMSSHKLAAIANEDDTGDFDIFEDQPLGEGGMGTLLRGRQRSLDRAVAIKVIREAFHTHPEFLQRFRREGELLAQIDNANVVQIIGTGVWRGRLFYAMELVKGEDLAARQKRGHRSTPEEILHLAEGVGNALRAAWRYKIVHRDIKPSNIMVTPEGMVKVADFGLAKSLRMPGAESRVLAGTPEYLSPEQGLGQKADIRSDIYSFGVVLYELAAGRHPFREAQSSVAMIYQHVHTEPRPLEQLDPRLPPAIRSLIHRCLQKNPDDRFSDPDALLSAIREARKNLALPLPERGPAKAQGSSSRRRITVAVAGIAAAGILIIGFRLFPPAANVEAESSFEEAYSLRLGLGDYAQAKALAEARKGRDSKEYREAEHLERRSRLLPLWQNAQGRVDARDWAGAVEAYTALRSRVDADQVRATETALGFCRTLAEAAGLETRGDWAAALAIYSKLVHQSVPQQDYLQESIQRVRRHLPPSAPH